MRHVDRTVLITGGSAGIGLALARAYSRLGSRVMVTGRRQARLDTVAAELSGVVTVRSDISSDDDRRALAARVEDEFPELDLLINNAGILHRIDLRSPNGRDCTAEIATNLIGPLELTRLLLPTLLERQEAAIVNVSSGLAYVPLAVAPYYCATKAALHSFSDSLRDQLRDTPVSVHEVLPPPVDTELTTHAPKPKPISSEECADAILKGLARDRAEIPIGVSKPMSYMGRMAPRFTHRMLNRAVQYDDV